jgi:hypothetical protein
MWIFNITAHSLFKDAMLLDNDVYSGAWPNGFNDPTMQNDPDFGPLPEGFYTILGPPFDDAEHGPYILKLEPDKTNVMYGRSGFLMHGKPEPPRDIRTGSKGCLCAGPDTRRRVYQSGDIRLQVIAGIPDAGAPGSGSIIKPTPSLPFTPVAQPIVITGGINALANESSQLLEFSAPPGAGRPRGLGDRHAHYFSQRVSSAALGSDLGLYFRCLHLGLAQA